MLQFPELIIFYSWWPQSGKPPADLCRGTERFWRIKQEWSPDRAARINIDEYQLV